MRLAENVFLARVDNRSVVLDLERDRYFGLGPQLTAAACALLDSNAPARVDDDEPAPSDVLGRELLRRGILVKGAAAPRRAPPPLPARSRWPRETDRPTLRQPLGLYGAVSALRALAEVRSMLRHRPFARLIARIESHPTTRAVGPDVQALVDAFRAARPFFPDDVICRLDAPALCLHLRRAGQACQLVFGVRLDPFVAHCWAQQGDEILEDSIDRVKQFTPLLAV